jgi:parallel beta-helix repeat protein
MKKTNPGLCLTIGFILLCAGTLHAQQQGPLSLNDAITPAAAEGFVKVDGGTFTMGSPASEAGRNSDEVQHQVTVSGFYLGKYVVTQAEYQAVIGTNPSEFKGDNLPVENVSWYDAVNYCNALSRKEGLTPAYTVSGANVTWNRSANGYRLPTEAEWEYAAKGGALSKGYTYSGSNTVGDAGWHSGNSGSRTHEAGTKAANELGLYDMSGNVWEWCWDWYDAYGTSAQVNPAGAVSGVRRVARGGAWNYIGEELRSANRDYSSFPSSTKVSYWGFRVVRPLSAPPPAAAPSAAAPAAVNQSSPGLYAGSVYQGQMDIYDAIDWIALNAQDGGKYSIVLGSDQAASGLLLDCGGKRVTVSLKAAGGERKVTFAVKKPGSSLFTVNKGVTVTLEDGVVLTGVQDSGASLVQVSGGTFIMNGGAIRDNKKSGSGSGVHVASGTFTMSGGSISGNTAGSGGGGVYVSGGTFTMNNGAISGNTASGGGFDSSEGGGVLVASGVFTMNNGTISGNTADRNGGGVCIYGAGTFTMSGGIISGNTAKGNSSYGGYGAGVDVYGDGTFTMSNGVISGNTAGRGGGGVWTEKRFTMSGGSISGNTASGEDGGGAGVGETFTMSGGIISGNTAKNHGGGVYAGGTFTKAAGTGSIIYGSNAPEGQANKAGGDGQAVYAGSGKKRDTTTRVTTVLDSTKSGAAGGWE